MCIFSGPVRDISRTHIFVAADDKHTTIYAMALDTKSDVAMILPVPVAAGTTDDEFRFVDLSGYPELFRDMDRLFPDPDAARGLSRGLMKSASFSLPVHEVGSFVASFVPMVNDFDRLDPRFRLPETVWSTLPDYAEFGFAVFQFRPGNQAVHPMAYRYPPAMPDCLFFPTVHVHDGRGAPRTARFDHHLYYQETDGFREAASNSEGYWDRSHDAVARQVDLDRTQGLIGDRPIFRYAIEGPRLNKDQRVRTYPSGTLSHVAGWDSAAG